MTASFALRTLDELTIHDERACRHVPLYADLKAVVLRAGCRFRVLPKGGRWDRALLLNLTFWGTDGGGDVLVDEHIAADVVAHVAWHSLASTALRARGTQSSDALLLGEAIASAFDVYLVGALLGRVKRSSFLDTQVPAMADVARDAGLSARGFAALLATLARDPARAFEDLRALLFDVGTELVACTSADDALAVLASHERHRFAPLLHHYALSTWALYSRAYAAKRLGPDRAVRKVDEALRRAPVSLDWLAANWVAPALKDAPRGP